jgi:hypothetical protein
MGRVIDGKRSTLWDGGKCFDFRVTQTRVRSMNFETVEAVGRGVRVDQG